MIELLECPTASPLQTGVLPELRRAQERYAQAAAELGFSAEWVSATAKEISDAPETPAGVREALTSFGPDFLASQPNLVLTRGRQKELDRRLMFNVHLDTVGGDVPHGIAGRRVSGRGAVDAKGPSVGLLAGLERAYREHAEVMDAITVIIQAVGGEEGGAMGVHGTRTLARRGLVGRLNVFCEPTKRLFHTRSTASMTARLTVEGRSAIDDHPEVGHNATVILGYFSQLFAAHGLEAVLAEGGRLCIGGVHTGDTHDRVYGAGHLYLNIAYPSASAAARCEAVIESLFERGLREFPERFGSVTTLERTSRDLAQVTRLEWLKRRLPVLSNSDEDLEKMLREEAGIPNASSDVGFTCDAIWLQRPDTFTIIFGPGGLDENCAHGEGEFIDLSDLELFADDVSRIAASFASYASKGRGQWASGTARRV